VSYGNLFHNQACCLSFAQSVIEQGSSQSARSRTDQGGLRAAANHGAADGSHRRSTHGTLLRRTHALTATEKDGEGEEQTQDDNRNFSFHDMFLLFMRLSAEKAGSIRRHAVSHSFSQLLIGGSSLSDTPACPLGNEVIPNVLPLVAPWEELMETDRELPAGGFVLRYS
jgi:hypothetical protein